MIILLGFVQFGCKDLSQLRALGRGLNEDLAPARISVALTDQIILTVTVADSGLAEGPCDARVGFALRVGRSLRDYYVALDSLQVVHVAFAHSFDREGMPARPQLPVRFGPAVLKAASQAADSLKMVSSCQAYEEL